MALSEAWRVYGEANATGAVGVWDQSTANTGVAGISTNGVGVYGQSTSGRAGEITLRLQTELLGVAQGRLPDPYGWRSLIRQEREVEVG